MKKNPCRARDLFRSDKNNPTCMKCSKRIAYVAGLSHDLCFASSRSNLDAAAARYSFGSHQVRFLPLGTDG